MKTRLYSPVEGIVTLLDLDAQVVDKFNLDPPSAAIQPEGRLLLLTLEFVPSVKVVLAGTNATRRKSQVLSPLARQS
jgi:hypothetical protein